MLFLHLKVSCRSLKVGADVTKPEGGNFKDCEIFVALLFVLYLWCWGGIARSNEYQTIVGGFPWYKSCCGHMSCYLFPELFSAVVL